MTNHGRGARDVETVNPARPRVALSASSSSSSSTGISSILPPPRKKARQSDPTGQKPQKNPQTHPSKLRSPSPPPSIPRQTQLSQFFTKRNPTTATTPASQRTSTSPQEIVTILDDSDDQDTTIRQSTATASPALTMLGKAPTATLRAMAHTHTPSSFASSSNKPGSPASVSTSSSSSTRRDSLVSPTRHAAEEEDWLQRAQALAGRSRSRRSDDPADEHRPAKAPRRSELKTSSARPSSSRPIVTPASKRPTPPPLSPETPPRPASQSASREPTPALREPPPASRAPPLSTSSSSSDSPPPSAEPSHQAPDRIEETPWMHEDLSAMSMLPWEMDAALKAADYRISAGLQPTRRDIEARENLQREFARKAHQDAMIRSFHGVNEADPLPPRVEYGRKPRPAKDVDIQTTKNGSELTKPQREEAVTRLDHAQSDSLLPPSSILDLPSQPHTPVHNLPSRPCTPGLFAAPRQPLTPTSASNRDVPRPVAPFKSIFHTPTPSPTMREGAAALNGDQNHPVPLGSPGEEPQDCDIPTSAHRAYVLRRGNRSTPRATSFTNGEAALPVRTPQALPALIRSPRTNRRIYALETQNLVPLPLAPPQRADNTPGGSTLKQALLSKRASPKRRESRTQAPPVVPSRSTSSSSLSSAPPLTTSSLSSPPPRDPSSSDTQPLSGGYDDEFSDGEVVGMDKEEEGVGDDTVLAPGPSSRTQRRRSCSPEQIQPVRASEETQPLAWEDEKQKAPDADEEETQPLPFPPGESETEEEEDEILLRSALRWRAQSAGSIGKASGWSRVNDAWRGVDLPADTRAAQTPRTTNQAISAQKKDSGHQSLLQTFGFSGRPTSSKRRREEEAFFSRDTRDVLSDDEEQPHNARPMNAAVEDAMAQGEETQPLPWATQSSHTEEEEDKVLPRRLNYRGTNTNPTPPDASNGLNGRTNSSSSASSSGTSSWLPSSQELQKEEYRSVREFLRKL